ncbi:MAG: hypothetical protein ACJAXT_000096 [Paracoccaceae bacterium]|jgi:hypothetical protein
MPTDSCPRIGEEPNRQDDHKDQSDILTGCLSILDISLGANKATSAPGNSVSTNVSLIAWPKFPNTC